MHFKIYFKKSNSKICINFLEKKNVQSAFLEVKIFQCACCFFLIFHPKNKIHFGNCDSSIETKKIWSNSIVLFKDKNTFTDSKKRRRCIWELSHPDYCSFGLFSGPETIHTLFQKKKRAEHFQKGVCKWFFFGQTKRHFTGTIIQNHQ